MNSDYTPGHQRTVHWANFLAYQANQSVCRPEYLLWGVYFSESRAAQLLAQYRIDANSLLTAPELSNLPLPANFNGSFDSRLALPTVSDSENATTLPPNAKMAEILRESSFQSSLLVTDAQESSEHILLALTVVDSPAKDFLSRVGCTRERLRAEIQKAHQHDESPIDDEIQLELTTITATQQTDFYRVIDAAANRAREGLRVVEDYARFVMDDAGLTTQLKQVRHKLAEALSLFTSSDLLRARHTQGDVGTAISTPQERLRNNDTHLLQANCKRVQEALRTLEEFSKLTAPDASSQLEQLRYQFYTIESNLFATRYSQQTLAGCQLYLLATDSLCHHGLGPAVRDSLSAGVAIVQVREKELTDRQLLDQALRVRQWTQEAGALLIINDRPDIAVLSNADGVHVGQDELSVRDVRRIVGTYRMVGVSTHTIEQARQAVRDGADYLGVGPVFPSATKQFNAFAGLDFVSQVADEITLPWFAIGGINAANLPQVIEAGATRVAVSGAICGVESPENAARELMNWLSAAGNP